VRSRASRIGLMPRVLLISYFFPPIGGGGIQRALGWSRYLLDFGWDVTVLAADPRGGRVEDPSLLERVRPSTQIIRVHAPTATALWRRFLAPSSGRPSAVSAPGRPVDEWLKALARFFLLPDSYRPWAMRAVRAGRERIARGGIDAVISTSPPETSHLVGEALARGGVWRLPWIADFRDPWVALHYRRPPTGFHVAMHRRLERRVFEGADRILCASHAHERAVRKALGAAFADRVLFHPNGTDSPPAPNSGPMVNAVAAPCGRARIVFTGHVSELPALDVFLHALARRLTREPDLRTQIEVRLVGPYDVGHARRARALGLDGLVIFDEPVPYAEARRMQHEATVLLLLRNEGRGYAAMVPGKLYEYLEARRPLVAMISEGEAAEIARSCGAVVVGPGDGDRAVDAILHAVGGGSGAARPNHAAIAALFEKRSRRALAGELVGILNALAGATEAARTV
jgi:glycosyltransferase involved in cell wall biosynthesis